MHQSEAVLTADFRGQSLGSTVRSSVKTCCKVTLLHTQDDIPRIVNRTAGQIVLLLRAECSAENVPILDTDVCPQLYITVCAAGPSQLLGQCAVHPKNWSSQGAHIKPCAAFHQLYLCICYMH